MLYFSEKSEFYEVVYHGINMGSNSDIKKISESVLSLSPVLPSFNQHTR
jgi:hypothetical protein